MAYTYSKISSVTVGSGGSSSIDFIAIPQNYTDLVLVSSLRNDQNRSPEQYIYHTIKFNNSSSNYSWRSLYAEDPTVRSQSDSGGIYFYSPTASAVANIFSNNAAYFPNYAGNTYKSASMESGSVNNASGNSLWLLDLSVGLWSQTAAINQITIVAFGTTKFVQYSTATLYGVKAEV
jgi:hypothetical protein